MTKEEREQLASCLPTPFDQIVLKCNYWDIEFSNHENNISAHIDEEIKGEGLRRFCYELFDGEINLRVAKLFNDKGNIEYSYVAKYDKWYISKNNGPYGCDNPFVGR